MSSVEILTHKNKNHRAVRTGDLYALSVCAPCVRVCVSISAGGPVVADDHELVMPLCLPSRGICSVRACVRASLFADMTTTKSVLTKACFSAAEPQTGRDENTMFCMWSAVQIRW